MDARSITDLVRFAEDGAHRETLAETDRLFAEVICLDRAQETGLLSDPGADALFVVTAGEAVLFIDRKRRRLGQWEAAVAEAGSVVMLRNSSTEPAVVLVVTAPPPVA